MKNTAKLLVLVAVGLALAQAGCNDPLTVKLPDIIPPGALSDSAALATLRAGAIGDFDLAYTGDHPDGSGGNGEGVILYGGLLADEFVNSETFPTRIQVDSRSITFAGGSTTNSDVDLWYRLMHRARRSAEATAARYKAKAPGDPGYPEILNLAGYTYIFFAETFCSGTPVSQIDSTGKITYGQPLTTTQLLDTAIARFDSAITIATTRDTAPVVDTSVQHTMIRFATVGKARALLFQGSGQYAAAAALAATIPTSFAYVLEHTTTTDRENNGVFNGGATDGRYTLADSEGVSGFPWLSVPDARTPFQKAALNPDTAPSALERAVGRDGLQQYDAALRQLSPADRQAIVARIELQQSYEEVAIALDLPDAEAARAAVTAALARLIEAMA